MSNSPTAPGQNNTEEKNAKIDAITQVFALFRVNYHNQFFKAFGDTEVLNQTQRLWLEMLARFSPEIILKGAKKVIEESEYLPTLHTMIRCCEQADSHLHFPDAHSAYLEACNAPSPKAAQQWSHPAVYHAGKATDWFFLQSNAENVAFPIFKNKYYEVCEKIRSGELLTITNKNALEQKEPEFLAKSENHQRMKSLISDLDL